MFFQSFSSIKAEKGRKARKLMQYFAKKCVFWKLQENAGQDFYSKKKQVIDTGCEPVLFKRQKR